MRDYQRQKNNKWILPKNVYRQTLWLIRDYYRMKEELKRIMEESPSPSDGMPRGSGTGRPVEAIVIRRERYADKVREIDRALDVVPEEYQAGVWQSILYGAPYPEDAARRTYGVWKARFIHEVAVRCGLI